MRVAKKCLVQAPQAVPCPLSPAWPLHGLLPCSAREGAAARMATLLLPWELRRPQELLKHDGRVLVEFIPEG
jgi:hypothetical protein